MDLSKVLRRNIMALAPYSCARDEFKGEASVFIDANESPYENGVNRYPDPLQAEVKKLLAPLKNVAVQQIFLGNGSDEAIDLIYRIFCEPRRLGDVYKRQSIMWWPLRRPTACMRCVRMSTM